MTHRCLQCGKEYQGGEEMLILGCQGCGGRKFVFVPDRVVETVESKAEERHASGGVDSVGESADAKTDSETGVVEAAGERVESVRIVSPGSYELNLDHLLERDELVMALKEEGTYHIHLPSVFEKNRNRKRR